MTIELREVQPSEGMRSSWEKIMIALQPIVDNLPRKEDRDYFKGILSFLIGKEPRISNIPKHLMFIYIRKARLISKFYYYRNIISMDYIKRLLIDFLSELALSLGEDGLFIKYGFGGFQQSFVQQKIEQTQPEVKKKGWLF
jgi:hypothetical protein